VDVTGGRDQGRHFCVAHLSDDDDDEPRSTAMKRQRDDDTPPSLPLQGRVVLVTGAGGGLGRACCLTLAQRGAKVALADRSQTKEAEEMVRAALPAAETCSIDVDVADETSVDAMVAAAVKAFGRLDGAVNAAGIEGGRAPLHLTSMENYDRVLGVNLRGSFLCMKAQIAQMLAQAPPSPAPTAVASACNIDALNYSIVNVSSTAGMAAMPEFACCARKGSYARAACLAPSELRVRLSRVVACSGRRSEQGGAALSHAHCRQGVRRKGHPRQRRLPVDDRHAE
jgi:NAD(P)-dependent dehydrogenase (short-subunit alcohol dehydrogenase family)